MGRIYDENDPIGKPLMLGNHTLPGIWQYMMPPEFLGMRFPEERRSTCMSCPKACFEDYRADYRCCTYHPRIPNFLLGLAIDTAPGRKAVEGLIAKGMATPEGMNTTPQQWIDYLEDLEHDRFGKSQQVLCPMLDEATGYCNIHAFRNSVCSTFFCLKDHGDRSENFWQAVQTLGSQMEMSLSQWAMTQLDFDVDDYVKRMNSLAPKIKGIARPDGGWSDDALKVLWGDWYGREMEFYLACGELASKHRSLLWEIAGEVDISEAHRFDRAMVASVPDELEDQIDPSDMEEDAEAAEPIDLWRDVEKAYRKLWQLPKDHFVLNQRIDLAPNQRSDPMEKTYKNLDYVVSKLVGKKKEPEWRLFVDADQYKVLQEFQQPQFLGWELLASPKLQKIKSPQAFLGEMIAKKILVRARV